MNHTLQSLGGLVDILPDAMLVVDATSHIVLANAAVGPILGYDAAELVGQPLECLVPPRWRAEHASKVAAFQRTAAAPSMSARPVLHALHKSGHTVPVSIALANIDLQGERFTVAVIRDAANVRDHLAEAAALAHTDALTGIGNRLQLSQRMQAAIAEQRPFALLFFDLQRFKPFNDRHGHPIGDEVLRIVARRLRQHTRASDLAVRLGGDEFVLLVDGMVDAKRMRRRAEALADGLQEPFRIGDLASSVGVNIGAARFPRDGASAEHLLAAADRRMYAAKNAGRTVWPALRAEDDADADSG